MSRFLKSILMSFLFLFSFTSLITAQYVDLDTVKAQKFDTGKMWTFEDAPLEYWKNAYGFEATDDWLEEVRLSSLRLSTGCSAAFVSEDGLVFTNHHCIDGIITRIQQEGEDLAVSGFYAETLEDERRIPNVWVDQMVLIEDVTEPIINAINEAASDAERVEFRDAKIDELEKEYSEEYDLLCNITRLYNGGKYSLYGYKRYTDVRAVMFVERIVGLYGGDPDNYTYPRYGSDFAILRIYDEDGDPLDTDNYFKFGTEGPAVDEVLFAIGTPGNTNRLKTISQLEYNRDVFYKYAVYYLDGLVRIYDEMMNEYPDKAALYQGAQFGPANIAKRWGGFLTHLRDPYLMARKADFEKTFKEKVNADSASAEKYGHIWDAIAFGRRQLTATAPEFNAFGVNNFFAPEHFKVGLALYNLAKEMEKPEDERTDNYKGEELENTINSIFPAQYDTPLQKKRLALHIDYIIQNLGKDHKVVKKHFGDKNGTEAAEVIFANSFLGDKDKVMDYAKNRVGEILTSGDPIMEYFLDTREKFGQLRELRIEILNTETALEDQLGRALFDIYGTSIPPDATFTLRITDGVMKTYEYNGTIAPKFTTFYGLYDRYYSHEKTWPWDLPNRWINYGPNFDLSVMNNFQGTFDTAGGSSGSPIVNGKGEYVGIIHDGNMEGLSGDFINTTQKKRSLALSSAAMYQVVKNLFGYERIAIEMETGELADK